jgi:hypothetical protein
MPKRTAKMTHLVAVRLDDEQSQSLNEWRRRQPDPPSRAEAIRQLMEIGLTHQQEAKPRKGAKS